MNSRVRWLLLVLIVVLLAAFWPREPDGEPEVVTVAERPSRQSVTDASESTRTQAAIREPGASLGAMTADLFPAQTWRPPPPKPKPVVQPPPAPPSLPFRYLGRWVEGKDVVVFLSHGEWVLLTRKGDTLAGTWRVDDITQEQMKLTYLPLNMQQILRIAQ